MSLRLKIKFNASEKSVLRRKSHLKERKWQTVQRGIHNSVFTIYFQTIHILQEEKSGACIEHEKFEKFAQTFGWRTW